MKPSFACGASAMAIALSVGFWSPTANAAAAASTTTTATNPASEVSEVVVTGSLIQGTPLNAALPVSVMTSDNIQKQGAPTIVELVKQLPESSGVIGESNQFSGGGRGQGQYGQSTINLRGLGPERTLILFNGHRLPLAEAFAVDTIMLPLSAIGRVEVLKDGAAATYGSDAIGGVVNFITKKNINGLEVGGDYRWLKGSKGDYTINAAWGHTFDNWDVLIAGGYQHRSELDVVRKPWAHVSYDANPEGGWTGGGNPEAFTPSGPIGPGGTISPLATSRVDLGCAALGGQLTTAKPANVSPLLPWTSCRGQYTIWDALEEETSSYQIYSEVNVSLGGSHKLHMEAAYSYTNLPFFKSSPSYVTTRPVPTTVLPTLAGGGTAYAPALLVAGTIPVASFFYYVPIENPGFAAYNAANPGQFPVGTTGALLQVGTFRPFLTGGNPLYNYTHGVGGRYWHQQIDLSVGLKGDLTSAIHYDTSLTWGQYKYYGEGRDSLTDRLELALRGLGGPSCNYLTGTPGVGGCMWLNPFSNAIPGAPRNGLTNAGYVSSVANTAALADWLMPIQTSHLNFQDIEYDFVLNGKLPFVLPGGEMAWAGGFQVRHNSYVTQYSQWGNAVLAPCSDSALPGGSNVCVPATGANVFGPVSNPVNLRQTIYSVFGQLDIPLTDRLFATIAARYEDYGANGGHTFNPQARAKWQVSDTFAIRGSIGTTFRAPPQGFLVPDPQTSLQQVLGTFIPVSAIGNPKLVPETALTWSVGGILESGGLHLTVDYWSYNFKKLLTTEPLTQVVGALNCASADPNLQAFIASHFVFSSPTCDSTKIVAVNLLRINGPQIKTDGVDVNASYNWSNVGGGALTVGGAATYVNKYTISSFAIGGVPIAGFNAAGFFNSGTLAYPIPKWKGSAFINFERGPFNIRWTARYTGSYKDQRAALFEFNRIYVTPTNPSGINANGKVIDKRILHDVAVRVELPWNTVVTAAMTNVFDTDPAFARTEINYDALTGDPLGRTFKLGVQKKF